MAKLGIIDGKLVSDQGSLLVVPDGGPCCLCEGCDFPGFTEKHFVMTPPTVQVTLSGVTVNPNIDWGQPCDPPFNQMQPNYPSCEQTDCEAVNDTYELPRGINPAGIPHPDPNDLCNWSEFFEGFDCDSFWCVDPKPTLGGTQRLHLSVHLQYGVDAMNRCQVLLRACASFFDNPPWAAFGPWGDNFCFYDDNMIQFPQPIHTFADGDCVWKLSGQYTLVLEGGVDPSAFGHPFCNWDAAQVVVDFG